MKLTTILAALALSIAAVAPAAGKNITLSSPDNHLTAHIATGDSLTLAISRDGQSLLSPSTIGLTLGDGSVVGPGNVRVASRRSVDSRIPTPFYRHDSIDERYNELTLRLSRDWDLLLRAYDDGIAYRFVAHRRKPFTVRTETASFRFPADANAWAPYANVAPGASFERQFRNSFENTYHVAPIDSLDSSRLIFLPMAVQPAPGAKMLITESALENYPGMFLNTDSCAPGTLRAVMAPRPAERHQGGHNNLQMLVDSREDYIATVDGPRAFPWRIAVVAPDDATLASTDLSYLLAEPSRLADTSWIKPGKVAWDWWNDWNLRGVDFTTGVNNDTYKAYIDFAARRGIEYVILDEGWAVNGEADLMKVVPEIDIPQLVSYADSLGVGLILWAGYLAFDRDMENVCRHYADMGIKGFKVDFMDHDDQLITDFNYRAAETAARHHLLLDLHGTSKPAGLNRTWPNVLNFEGVNGLEQMKWAPNTLDQVTYDVQIPFLRQAAGPMDYTQGAMRNATRRDYHPVYDDPMSQGTRCRQLALYMVLDSPLNMMCDTPSNYDAEPESTEFIAAVPTVWDETRILAASLGEYIITARRKGHQWWIGGITDWTPRDITLDLSFIADGPIPLDLFTDGTNAHRNARDYRRTPTTTAPDGTLRLHLAPGGGFALRTR